jgi:hypothetical protein
MTIYTFPIPAQLNGDQLQAEAGAESVRLLADELLIVSNKTQTEIAAILAAHVPKATPQQTIEEKLATAGISLDDLKAALGV